MELEIRDKSKEKIYWIRKPDKKNTGLRIRKTPKRTIVETVKQMRNGDIIITKQTDLQDTDIPIMEQVLARINAAIERGVIQHDRG